MDAQSSEKESPISCAVVLRGGRMEGKDRNSAATPPDGAIRSAMTLRRRLSLLVGVALTPPLLLTLHNVVRSQVVLESQTGHEALVAARQISDKLGQINDGGQQLIAVMSKHPDIANDGAACAAYFRSVIADIPIYQNAALVDADGKVHCSALPVSKDPSVADSMNVGRQSSIDRVVTSAQGDSDAETPSIPIYRPLTAVDGSSKRLIVLILNLERLARELNLEGSPLKSRGRILVLDREGSSVLTIPRDETEEAKATARHIFPQLASIPAGVITAQGLNERPEIVGFAPVPNAPRPLFTAVAIDREIAVAEAQHANFRSLVLAAITAMFAIGCTWFATHFLINRPIRAVVDAARRREAGDMGAQFPRFSHSTEFGQMSAALSRMST